MSWSLISDMKHLLSLKKQLKITFLLKQNQTVGYVILSILTYVSYYVICPAYYKRTWNYHVIQLYAEILKGIP